MLPYISKVCIVLPLIFKDLVVSLCIFKNSVAPLCISKVWTELPLCWVGSPQILEVLVSSSHIFKLWMVSPCISKVWYSSFYTFKKYHNKKPMHIHCTDTVRTYVINLLGTYVTILFNWLILWQNALYLYFGRFRMCLIL